MRQLVWKALQGTLAIGCTLAVVPAIGARAQQVQVSPANRTIAITTTETAERRADVATLHIGYHVYAPDSPQAYAAAAKASQAIASALARVGAGKEAISSENQSTQESQDYRNLNIPIEERTQRRFEAQQSWTVKSSPDAVAAVLAAAVDAGANESGHIDWALSDEASLTAEAGTKALAHAKNIATQMAQGLGAKIGNLMYASNEVEAIRPMMRAAFGRGMGGGTGGGVYEQKLNLSAPMISRSATVSAIFAIE